MCVVYDWSKERTRINVSCVARVVQRTSRTMSIQLSYRTWMEQNEHIHFQEAREFLSAALKCVETQHSNGFAFGDLTDDDFLISIELDQIDVRVRQSTCEFKQIFKILVFRV